VKKFTLIGLIIFLLSVNGFGQLSSIYDKPIQNSPQLYIIITTIIGVFLAGYSLYFKNLALKRRRNLNIVALVIMESALLYQFFILREPNLFANRFLLLLMRNVAIASWCYDYAYHLKLRTNIYRILGLFLPGLSMFLLAIKKHKII